MTPFTPDERLALSFSDLPTNKPDGSTLPYGWADVLHTQLSIARHYGGITFNGAQYTYFPSTDELWREDVCRFVVKLRRAAAREARRARCVAMQSMPAPSSVWGTK